MQGPMYRSCGLGSGLQCPSSGAPVPGWETRWSHLLFGYKTGHNIYFEDFSKQIWWDHIFFGGQGSIRKCALGKGPTFLDKSSLTKGKPEPNPSICQWITAYFESPQISRILGWAGLLSKKGRCLSFDGYADGYIRGVPASWLCSKLFGGGDGDETRLVVVSSIFLKFDRKF